MSGETACSETDYLRNVQWKTSEWPENWMVSVKKVPWRDLVIHGEFMKTEQ